MRGKVLLLLLPWFGVIWRLNKIVVRKNNDDVKCVVVVGARIKEGGRSLVLWFILSSE
jgi:hypothetical protein